MKKISALPVKIENKILNIRGESVMIDRDLAALYGVETKALNRAVKRNITRFPKDFMFQLTKEEKDYVVSNWHHLSDLKFSYTKPYVFTEQGVAMLSGVLNSERAVKVNIQIMRAFVAVRRALQACGGEKIPERLKVVEEVLLAYMDKNDKRVDVILQVLNEMQETEQKEVKKIGFIQ